jgi:hypothetical protein
LLEIWKNAKNAACPLITKRINAPASQGFAVIAANVRLTANAGAKIKSN